MDMPKDCIVCYETTKCLGTGRYFEDGTIWCGLAKGYIGLKDTSEKCPLVELPEKHGRLIDGDEVKTAFPCGESVRTECVRATIDNMPTIVEAEGDG